MGSLPNAQRWLLFGGTFPLIFLNVWLLLLALQYLQPIVSIVVSATLLAFILSYPVQLLQRRGLGRGYAVLAVFLLALVAVAITAVIVVPVVVVQLNELARGLPDWIDLSTQQIQALQDWAAARRLPLELGSSVARLVSDLASQLQGLTGRLLGLALDTAGSLLNLLLTVVLTYYLMASGEQLWLGLNQWLPAELGPKLVDSLRQNFQNYFIAQATLAALIGGSMTLVFLILQVPFALLFGLGIGLMALIPFGVPLTIALVSLLLGFEELWLGLRVFLTAIVVDQLVENAVAPRILGRFTGQNPVWILVALLLGAKIGGLLGLLVAVPMAGFIKSLADSLRAFLLVDRSRQDSVVRTPERSETQPR